MSEREQLSASVRERLEALSTVDASKELIRPDLGTANFERGVPILRMTVALFEDLRSLDMLVLPLEYLRRINQRAEITLNWLQEVRRFTLNDSNPTGTRDHLLQRLESEYDQHMTHLGAHIGYLLVKQTDFNALDAAARDKMRELDEFTGETRAKQDRIRTDMDAALRSVRAAAAEAGVGQQSIVFEDQVIKDTATASRWLRTVITLGCLSVVAVGWLLFGWDTSGETTAEIVREIGGRFAALTLLGFALGFHSPSIHVFETQRNTQPSPAERSSNLRDLR